MSRPALFQSPQPSKPVLGMDDVGTRIEHYTQLLDLWDGARFIMLAKSDTSRSAREVEMIEFLTHAIELLKKNMMGSNSGYNDASLKKLVDSLPKDATEITD